MSARMLSLMVLGVLGAACNASAPRPPGPAPTELRVAIEPPRAKVPTGGTMQFQAMVAGAEDQSVDWRVLGEGGGTVDESGLFTAPEASGKVTVRAISRVDPRAQADAEVEVLEGVVVNIRPKEASLEFGETLFFDADVAGTTDHRVVWSIGEEDGGRIQPSGRYTAPTREGVFTVTVTSVADMTRSDSAQVTVRSAVIVHVEPELIQLEPEAALEFTAIVTGGGDDTRVTWSVVEPDGGTVDETGTYRAPAHEGTFQVQATSVLDPKKSARATVVVAAPNPIDLGILPEDRRTVWDPGIPGGIPSEREVFSVLDDLIADGTGNNAPAIQSAIQGAGQAYQAKGVIQEVVLPKGTFRFTSTINLNRSGVVLRGQGWETRLRYDGDQNSPSIVMGRARWTNYGPSRGPWNLVSDGIKGSKQIAVAASFASNFRAGDILGIDEEDDTSFVRRGDAWYGKRQPSGDTHGPPLRGADLYRSVGTMVEVMDVNVLGDEAVLTLRDPLHMNFRVSQHAQIFQIASPREGFNEIQFSGLESFYLTGGPITTNNISYSWIDSLEIDGNPGTPNVGTYNNQGGISGQSIGLFHAYRFEIRGSYIHHSRNINQGGGAYLVALNGYTSESLIEDNIILFGNKLVVGNMMGGGNVIAYNYVDNARTNHASWQEGAIDLNHLSFSHSALVEGNWATNIGADSTHGNSGWHTFLRNYATGQNSAPIYGAYPYVSGAPDGSFRRAAGIDGYHRESTFIGNVLLADPVSGIYQVDHVSGPALGASTIWRIGGAVDGGGGNLDDGTALSLLYRHGNWDSVTGEVVWDEANEIREIPKSMYLQAKPAFFRDMDWPWIDPTAEDPEERVKVLPAKARYDSLIQNGG